MDPVGDQEILDLILVDKLAEKGFRLLMHKYQERVYWHIRRMVEDHDDANDLVQNVFIKVYHHLGDYAGRSSLYTWIYRIATNETLGWLNQQKNKPAERVDPSLITLQLKADHYIDGDSIQQRLQLAIQELPEKQRVVFNLRYYDEMSYADMSQVLQTTEGALKASYHHAVKKIESYIKNYMT